MERSSWLPSLKLPLMDGITKLLQNQDSAVKLGPSSSASLDIGQFVPNPPNRGNWYPVAGENFEHKPQIVPQSFANIAKPGYKSLPSALVNQKELIKLEFMVRECIATSNFLSTLSTVSKFMLNNLRAARYNREKIFRLLAAEPDPRARDQFLQQLLNSTLEDTSQMQFMVDISRSVAVAYQHLLEKFLHLLTNLVFIRRDAYLKHAQHNLDAYQLKNLRSTPISGPELFDRTLMQEYEQHLIGLGVKTGNQSSSRFHPYGKSKKKARGRGRGAYQQGGYYQVPVPASQYLIPQPFYPQPQCGGIRGGHRGRGSRIGAKTPLINLNNNPNNDTLVSLPQRPLGHDHLTTSKLTLDTKLKTPPEGGKDSVFTVPPGEGKDSAFPLPTGGGKDSVCSVKKCIYPRKYKGPPSGRPTQVVRGSVGEQRLPSFSDRHTQTRISSAIQKSPQAVQESLRDQRIHRHKQRQCIIQFYSGLANQKCDRKGGKTRQLGNLQPSFSSSKTREPLEASHRPKLSQNSS